MVVRPGTPITVTDEYLAAILAELRDINAKLGQDTVTTESVTVGFDPEAIKAAVAEVLDSRSGMIL